MEQIKAPTGEQDAPARSCKDLVISNPGLDLKDGMYWVDPNQGRLADSFQVYCKIATMETCVLPQPKMTGRERWATSSPFAHTSFYELSSKKFYYKAEGSQIRFLQLLSGQAYQNVTYHCRNSLAYGDAASGEQVSESAIQLERFDGEIITAFDENPKKRYAVSYDGCKNKADTWDKTVMEISTKHSRWLPVTDVFVLDVGAENQEFGIELGPVCFR